MHLTTFNVRCIMSDARNELSERCKSANIDITGCLGGLLIILGAFLPWFTSTTFGIMTLPQFQLIHTMFCLIFLSLGIALTLLSFTNKFKPKLILTFVHLVCLSAFSVVFMSLFPRATGGAVQLYPSYGYYVIVIGTILTLVSRKPRQFNTTSDI